MWALLQAIKTALEAIPELDTVGIGTERGISAKDTPAARIVTDYTETKANNRYLDNGELHIVLLLDLKNDLEEVYHQSIDLELLIRDALRPYVNFTRTEYDTDSLTNFKASIIRFNFSGIKNGRYDECDPMGVPNG